MVLKRRERLTYSKPFSTRLCSLPSREVAANGCRPPKQKCICRKMCLFLRCCSCFVELEWGGRSVADPVPGRFPRRRFFGGVRGAAVAASCCLQGGEGYATIRAHRSGGVVATGICFIMWPPIFTRSSPTPRWARGCGDGALRRRARRNTEGRC